VLGLNGGDEKSVSLNERFSKIPAKRTPIKAPPTTFAQKRDTRRDSTVQRSAALRQQQVTQFRQGRGGAPTTPLRGRGGYVRGGAFPQASVSAFPLLPTVYPQPFRYAGPNLGRAYTNSLHPRVTALQNTVQNLMRGRGGRGGVRGRGVVVRAPITVVPRRANVKILPSLRGRGGVRGGSIRGGIAARGGGVARGGAAVRGGATRGRGKGPSKSKVELDKEMDLFMGKDPAKEQLNAEMDAYMSKTKTTKPETRADDAGQPAVKRPGA